MSFFLNTTVCGFSLYHILAFFLIYSCLGWCVEVVYAAATTGQLVNRGFLNGPVCPIYGFGMIIVLFALTPLQHSILLLYIGGVILPSALELVGGWALYKIYHTRWWDYSDFPFNIGGYICLEFCLLWGVGTLVVLRIVHPVVADLVDLIPPFVGVILMCFLYAVYAVDVVATAIAASALADTLDTMEQLGDSIHAVSDAMTQLLGTTTLNADKKLDEGRLQFKLAAAEARDAAGKRPSARETMAAIRAKAAEASEAARRASEDARLNAAEAANAARLAAKGTAERAAALGRASAGAAPIAASTPAPAVEQTAASVEPTAAAVDSEPVADQPAPAAAASAKKDVDGLKVLVLCAGAGTSAMLANAPKEGAAQTGETIASSAGAYGQHTAIMDQYDVIVLAPQVRSYYNDMKADTDRLGIKLLAPRGKEYIDLTRAPAGAIKWLRENLD